ncbi:MAG: 3-methyl-2-oxobutanoate hydroxymethyltransferase [Myxococcales bacterium]|nr:3-methyl-2-oxobutanoate hydroxymethyltransferase [Myxococcales bacterium]
MALALPGNPVARLTAPELLKMKAAGEKIAMVTAYDFSMARLMDRSGADMVLVGDSLGMVIQGQSDTLRVTLDEMAYHGRCVARGLERAHLTIDMPFLSYQLSPTQALQNAGRLVQEGLAQAVKLEGGARTAPAIRACVEAGIPVVGHVGLTPQSVHAFGGFKVQGRDAETAARIRDDALAVQDAGAFCIVLEMIPATLAAELTALLTIPTIGIGAGNDCDGQVLVCNDLLGLDERFKPRFVKRFADLAQAVAAAGSAYVAEVKAGTFPAAEHGFDSSGRVYGGGK